MENRTYMIGVEATMDVIGGKWKPIILCNLRHGAMRPSDLKRGITGISQKMLTQLRELEEDNIIDRKVYQQVPPKVEYSLSDYGRSLSDILDSLCNWGEQHVAHLQEQGQAICLKAN
ncbi:helix-turn-helix domain-containing protein [Enterococcus avium]